MQRVSVSPEEAGLCGCWQFIAVRRERQEIRDGQVGKLSQDYSFYASSLAFEEYDAQSLADFIREHWAACEISSHYRRDVTFGEDASRIKAKNRAHVMASLRNLALGLFELQRDRGKTNAPNVASWRRQMTASAAIKLLSKGV